MFNFFKKTAAPTYFIDRVENGRFAIMSKNGTIVKDYARRADAVRGANRQGLTIA